MEQKEIREKKQMRIYRFSRVLTSTILSVMFASLVITGCSNNEKKAEETGKVEDTSVEETTLQETTEEETTEEATTVEETTEEKKALGVSDIYKNLIGTGYFSDMYSLDEEDMMDYYGIDASCASEYVFYQGSVSPSADVIALFRCTDDSSAKSVADSLQVVLDSIKESTKDYAPEEYEKASSAKVVNDGKFVSLVVCGNNKEAEAIVDNSK